MRSQVLASCLCRKRSGHEWTRTVARKFSIGGLWQNLNWFIVFHVSNWGGLELCLGGLSPQKPPRGDGTGVNCKFITVWQWFSTGFPRLAARGSAGNFLMISWQNIDATFLPIWFITESRIDTSIIAWDSPGPTLSRCNYIGPLKEYLEEYRAQRVSGKNERSSQTTWCLRGSLIFSRCSLSSKIQ